jgi:hypothetical protein
MQMSFKIIIMVTVTKKLFSIWCPRLNLSSRGTEINMLIRIKSRNIVIVIVIIEIIVIVIIIFLFNFFKFFFLVR